MPRYALLFDQDENVAQWCWKKFDLFPMPYNMAIGIIDQNDTPRLVGCAMFYWWNGCNIELNYYGPGTPTLGITRILATLAVRKFNVTRVTVRTRCENVIRGMRKLGFEQEGFEADFYGKHKPATRMVMFRRDLERLAGAGVQ